MGRAAKLRAARHGAPRPTSTPAAPKGRASYAPALGSIPGLTPLQTWAVDFLAIFDPTVQPPPDDVIPPADLDAARQVLARCRPATTQAIAETMGVLMFGHEAPLEIPWATLGAHAVTMTSDPFLVPLLAAWGAPAVEAVPKLIFPFSVIKGFSEGAVQRLGDAHKALGASRDERGVIGLFLGLIVDHLDQAANLAAGRTLHDAGHLVLHRSVGLADGTGRDLCLSCRSRDGLLRYWPHPSKHLRREPLPPSCIRSMRAFVRNYIGPPIEGPITAHPQAARLCRLIGLHVENGRGFLRPAA